MKLRIRQRLERKKYMTAKKKNQSTMLIISLVLLVVAAVIFTVLASVASKRVKTPSFGTDTAAATETAKAPKPLPESETSPATEDVIDTIPSDAEPVSLTVDEIDFDVPTDGAMLNECSLEIPVYSITMEDYRTHVGVDLTSAPGDPVRACAGGIVTSIWDDPMMGRSISITHSSGIETIYRNLAEETPDGIAVGSKVEIGDVIGAVGDTALIECEEEPHLHLELKVDGINVDPCLYMDFARMSETYED